jgi:hypothetical protein
MENKTIKMTPIQFTEIYGSDYISEKYGEDWMEVVINELEEKGIKIEFDYS